MEPVNPHPPGCFWHEWAEVLGAPNIKWCEPTICSVISEPANTWTNLSYVAIAVICYLVWRKEPNRTMTWFAPAIFAMGSLSFVYHMSNIFLTQLFDFLGMFFWVYLMLVIDLRRFGWVSRNAGRVIYWILVVGSSLAIWGLYVVGFPFQLVIALLAVGLIAAEVALRIRHKDAGFSYRNFVLTLVLLSAAQTFSMLDVSRVWCQPGNSFLHGHALWHLIGALATGFAFLHFRQFDLDSVEPAG